MVVPPNWDSWGKIRVLREGFDVEAVNNGWSLDIEESFNLIANGDANGETQDSKASNPKGGAVEAYEEMIKDPKLDALQATSKESDGLTLEVSSADTQTFLAARLEVLEKIRQGNEGSGTDNNRINGGRNTSGSGYEMGDEGHGDGGRVNEHIGPVQFNMGGIQVDADDMLQRLKVRYLPDPLVLGNNGHSLTLTRIVKHIRLQSQHPQALSRPRTVKPRRMKRWRTFSQA